MKNRLINIVILAEDYDTLVDWYIRTLDLEVKLKVDKDYHYTDLAWDGQLVVGICPATGMKHTPTIPRNNSTVLQISVPDAAGLFERVKANGGTILFGPAVDRNEGFTYGAFADPEGNQVWVMENFNFD